MGVLDAVLNDAEALSKAKDFLMNRIKDYKVLLQSLNSSFIILYNDSINTMRCKYCTDANAFSTIVKRCMSESYNGYCVVWFGHNDFIDSCWSDLRCDYNVWRQTFMRTPYMRFLGCFSENSKGVYNLEGFYLDNILAIACIFAEDIANVKVKNILMYSSADTLTWSKEYQHAITLAKNEEGYADLLQIKEVQSFNSGRPALRKPQY